MGIITELVTSSTNSTNQQKIFVDRESQKQKFRENLGAVPHYGTHLIYYAGTGGVGKTALINELKNSVQGTITSKIKFVSYDFTSGTELLTTLNSLKKFLADNYQVEFPFFLRGCLSYYMKCGDEIGKKQIEKILQEGRLIGKCQKKLESVGKQLYNARNADKITGESIETLGYIAEGTWIFRLGKVAINVLDEYLFTELQKSQLEYDSVYRNFEKELERREQHISPEAVKEYLPTLLAMDISRWLNKEDFYLVIFLDTYEKLTDDEKDTKPHEKLIFEERDVPVDWWIEDLIGNSLERVLWVIAGRGKIEKIGEKIKMKEEDHLFTLKALDNKFADEFLSKSGIEYSTLREGLVKLTGGYPIFLSLCADTYKSAILKNGTPPSLEKFGDKREDVIKRLLEFMDDGTRNMVKRLCVLGKWTELFATRVLDSLHELNYDTYNRVSQLSFVSAKGENIFVFDRNIREILLAHLKKNEPVTVTSTTKAVDKFFENVLVDATENKSVTNEDRIILFKLWAEFILSTTDNAEELMNRYSEKLASISSNFDNDVVEGVIVQFKNKVKESLPHAYFEHLFAQIKFAAGNDKYASELAKKSYEKIVTESNVAALKNYLTVGQYAMALFHAMGVPKESNDYKIFEKNFKSAVKLMFAAEKENLFENYGDILKCLLNVYRNFDEVISQVDRTLDFIGDGSAWLGSSSNEFVASLKLYKLTALSHLGKIDEFNRLAEECLQEFQSFFETGKNLELYLKFVNRFVVNLQDVFAYDESLKLGIETIDFLERDENFSLYKDQYFRLCGSLARTCYFTLNKSCENLEPARKFSDIAINGFVLNWDKVRSYQTRAQVEAEVDNFDIACEMLDKGLNISFKKLQAEDFKNFSVWQWYHFAKFSERLIDFEIVKHAVKISRAEFLNYRNKIGDTPGHPDYITFSKMATCFDILGDIELSLKLHETALCGVNEDVGDDAAAFKLVLTANELLTLERNNLVAKAEKLREALRNNFDEYLTRDLMKAPFEDWQELFTRLEEKPDDKLAVLEKMSRAILL